MVYILLVGKILGCWNLFFSRKQSFKSLSLRVASADSINNISLNNVTTSHVSNFTEGNETETLPVKAGDQITVVVSVIGGDRGAEHNPVTFTLTLEE